MSDADKARQILNNVAYLSTDLEDMRLLLKFMDGRTGNQGWRIVDTVALDDTDAPVPPEVLERFRDAVRDTIYRNETQIHALESRIRVVEPS